MKSLILAVTMACAVTALATVHAEEAAEKLELKSGSTVFFHPDGTSRMVDKHGKCMSMSDGEEMTLVDGRVVMMKNNKVWVRIGSPGGGHEVLRND